MYAGQKCYLVNMFLCSIQIEIYVSKICTCSAVVKLWPCFQLHSSFLLVKNGMRINGRGNVIEQAKANECEKLLTYRLLDMVSVG